MPAPKEIIKLVKKFEEHKDSYLDPNSNYGETELRTHFINPFFDALGWSMDNSVNASEIYMDVIHEAKVLVNGSTKAPDYSFGIATRRRFFVEAKRPSVNIENSREAAFQARSYGWSGTLPICILTNFNYLIVYNTTIRPHHKDNANKTRVAIYHYTDYLTKWDEIESRFSRQAVISGKFDEFATKPHKGTETIDNVFLAEIEEWREKLAKDIYKNNPKLSPRKLNTAVQLIIDRIIFLRICEDRGIETESTLQNISTQPKIYDSLKRLFQDADDKYNSGLFHFNKELGQKSVPDKLTLNLKINDPVFQHIFKSLYPPSPYAFSVMPPDILGQIYERFLGKVIRLTPKQVKIEEKPQVRKAGGVYYTPSHIVNYITKHTIGDLLDGSTPDKVAKIRILDPACGSGSFLIVAYEYLLKWHLKYYLDNPQKSKNKIVKNIKNGQEVWQLSIAERKQILTNNIYGVDIDVQAVAVTKLSLLLKVLEGGNKETIEREQQLKLLADRILPDLGDNIKCGNSLIGDDFYEIQSDIESLLDDADHYRINAFNWKELDGFPKIMKGGGFDAIIGNPPYVFARDESFRDYEKTYLYEKFNLQSYQLNTYTMFVELGLDLLRKKGKFGYIIPKNWLTISSLKSFRDHILSNTGNLHIVNYDYQVFDDAAVDTSTLIFEKTKPLVVKLFRALKDKPKDDDPKLITECDPQILIGKEVIPFDKIFLEAEPILKKINQFKRLGHYARVKAGVIPYEVGKGIPKQTEEIRDSNRYHADRKKDKSYQKLLAGRDVRRYGIDWSGQWLKYGENLAAHRTEDLFQGERILVRRIPTQLPYCLHVAITDKHYISNRENMIIHAKNNHNIKMILGLLNSKIISFWCNVTYEKLQRKTFPQFIIRDLINFPMALDSNVTDKISDKVDELMLFIKNTGSYKNPTIEAKIKKLNDELDALAYQAYGLAPEDIDFIEKSILPVEPPKSP